MGKILIELSFKCDKIPLDVEMKGMDISITLMGVVGRTSIFQQRLDTNELRFVVDSKMSSWLTMGYRLTHSNKNNHSIIRYSLFNIEFYSLINDVNAAWSLR